MIRGRALVVLLAVAGCTRPNADFDPAQGSTSETTAGTSQGGDDPVGGTTRGQTDVDVDADATRGPTSVDADTRGETETSAGTTHDPTDPTDPTDPVGSTTEPGNTATSEPPETSSSDEGVPVGICGDGMHDPPLEQCDDGNLEIEDGCNLLCMLDNPGACNNAQLDPGEQCDDGGNEDGDGCGPTCQLEHPELCGNGMMDAGEQCDDGNLAKGDICGPTCQWPVPVKKPKEPV